MMQMDYRNPQYNSQGSIDCEVNHPNYGWIPFTASPDDPEKYGRDLFEEMQGSASKYVAPAPQPEPVPQVVSRFQALAALSQSGNLAQARLMIEQGTEMEQLAFDNATEFRRSSPLINSMAIELGLNADELDDLFRLAITIEA